MKSDKIIKFEKLISEENSLWLEKALWRKENKKWLDQSAKIAVSVLEALSDKGWSQRKLAEEMQVSSQQINKIVKGQQNLTFETVAKIESALNISLMQILNYSKTPTAAKLTERESTSKKQKSNADFKKHSDLHNP